MIVKEILIEKVFIPQSFIDEERESNIENLMDSIEKEGLLTFEQKIFIQAGMVWKMQQNPGCPFFG